MFFKNISFRAKIFFVIFIAILIPTISVGTMVYKKTENAITNQTYLTISQSMNFVIGYIDTSLNIIDEMSNSILTDSRITSMIGSKGSPLHSDRVEKYSEARDFMSSFSNRIKSNFALSGIDSYYLYIPAQNIVIDSKSTFFENVDVKNIDFIRRLGSDGPDTWFVTEPFEDSVLGLSKSRLAEDKLITFNKKLYDDSGRLQAVLAINVDTNFISDNFNKIQTGTIEEIAVVDGSDNLISFSDKNLSGQKNGKYKVINGLITETGRNTGSFFYSEGSRNDFVIYAASDNTNWRYIVIIPASHVLKQVWQIRDFLLLVFCIVTLLIFGITYLLSFIFYKPLEKIVCAMQEIENRNLQVKIDDKRKDEYHQVYKGFNDMVTELNHLLKDLTNEKILKKEAEIKLLQAQINPHFLYNTLESIHSIAKIKKVDEISLMVAALSRFFRISLSGGKDVVTLREAIELVLSYLTIQNTRFNGKIDYRIDISDELQCCLVPKLILQPVVENSIYHGIEKMKGTGLLTITGRLQEADLILSVEDNGVGIPADKLSELQKSILNDSFEDSGNFALKNLNRQLKLKYGSEYGVNIVSAEGSGTSVFIKLPFIVERGAA